LAEETPRTAASSLIVDHPDWALSRPAGGGLRLEPAGRAPMELLPDGDGWAIEVDGEDGTWRVRAEAPHGFVLVAGDGRELGRTQGLPGVGDEANLSFLLLEDGRLFRVVLRGPRDGRFELLGWETPGAYLVARPGDARWTISPTAACGGLSDLRAILILFAAEIVAAEDWQAS
jgi:hypothetical protein